MPKILVADPIHDAGVALLRAEGMETDVCLKLPPEELIACISEYDALVVRSETKVVAAVLEAGHRLQVVGRAGVGVDNIDLDAATKNGVAVVNAPTGNILAAAEHTIALLMAMARNVSQADASLKRGEWRRAEFMGVEIRGKTLGIVGLGRVGSEVARRARGLDMRLLAYDPFVSPERANLLGAELATLQQILSDSDFVTIHTPLTAATRQLLGAQELAQMKPGARIINVARGDLIDENALLQALENGQLAGAALDVFDQEPPENRNLINHSKVVSTPHLGASTIEAQADVAKEVVEQVLAVLRGQPAQFTVNAPFVSPELHELVSPYLQVAADVGKVAIQITDGQLSTITLHLQGQIAQNDTRGLKAAALVGLLGPISDERINLVNATLLAEARGIQMQEEYGEPPEQYTNLVTIEITTSEGPVRVSGTYINGRTHIVGIWDYWMDAALESPYLLIIDHQDAPGLIGAMGTITGQHDINISSMTVGRLQPRGKAAMVVGLDDSMPEQVIAQIQAIPRVTRTRVVRL
jgi:D-3-phosphoglycerate dehydrogenase